MLGAAVGRLKAGAAPTRRSRIAELIVKPSIVFAIKPSERPAYQPA